MDRLGFTVHQEKSSFIPIQILRYLGFLLNSINMTVTLTAGKIAKVKLQCWGLVASSHCTIRDLAKVIGTLVATEDTTED